MSMEINQALLNDQWVTFRANERLVGGRRGAAAAALQIAMAPTRRCGGTTARGEMERRGTGPRSVPVAPTNEERAARAKTDCKSPAAECS